MSEDYIKREDAAKILLQRREFADNQDWPQEVDLMELLCERLDEIPAADVVERKTGKWIEDDDGYQICSECGAEHHWLDYRASFCEDCGAEMLNGGDEA